MEGSRSIITFIPLTFIATSH